MLLNSVILVGYCKGNRSKVNYIIDSCSLKPETTTEYSVVRYIHYFTTLTKALNT